MAELLARATRVLTQLEAWLPPAPPATNWDAHAFRWRKRGTSHGWLDAIANVSMSSTKSAIGHLLGGAGAVESIFCILALRDQIVPPTLNLDNPDEGTEGVDLVPHVAKKREVKAVLNNSFGFGGTNASLIMKAI